MTRLNREKVKFHLYNLVIYYIFIRESPTFSTIPAFFSFPFFFLSKRGNRATKSFDGSLKIAEQNPTVEFMRLLPRIVRENYIFCVNEVTFNWFKKKNTRLDDCYQL